jgi:hypothetical protein
MLFVRRSAAHAITTVAYDGEATMGAFLRDVLAPLYALDIADDATVLAKVHTPDLRVVFNRESRDFPLKALLDDWSTLLVAPWPSDTITARSLRGNAG